MGQVPIVWWLVASVAAAAAGWLSAWAAGRFALGAAPGSAPWGPAVLIAADLAVALLATRLIPDPTGRLVTVGLGWSLVLLAWIDVLALRLPDLLTLPLTVIGLGLGPWILHAPFVDHLVGAAAGFVALAAVGWIYERLRGRQGLGLGDAKLLAAGGAWLGWMALPTVVVLACAAGLAWVGLTVLAGRRLAAAARIPFGPALAAALWAVWLWGVAQPAAL